MQKIYIAGPITGIPNYANKFRRAAHMWRVRGALVMSPHVLPEGFPWDVYMPICYAMMDCCDTIYMLPGWERSKGAALEHDRATERGMTVIYG